MTVQPSLKVVKCEGRFSALREFIFRDAVPLVLNERTNVTEEDISNIWSLLEEDLWNDSLQDPYFESSLDEPRRNPNPNYLSLIPFFPSDKYTLEPKLLRDYAVSMGVSPKIAEILSTMQSHKRDFYTEILGKDPRNLSLPNGANLQGYQIWANTGIGSLCQGGYLRGGIRSDAPFLLEIRKRIPKSLETNLAAVVGFWPQGDSILIAQMQSCKNAQLPEEVPFGVTGIMVAEKVARTIGFEKIQVYTARANPIFIEHPETWERLSKDFVAMWDGSVKKVGGYLGSRSEVKSYTKLL